MHVSGFLSQSFWKFSNSSLKVADEDEILPPKLQAALMQILEERNEILAQEQKFSPGMRQVTVDSRSRQWMLSDCPAPCSRIRKSHVEVLVTRKLIISFLADPQMCQVPFYFRTSALAQFHLWNAVPPDVCLALAFFPCRFILKCHFLSEVFLECPVSNWTHSLSASCHPP